MRVEALMTGQAQYCQPEDSLEHCARLMWDRDCGCLPVCSGESKVVIGMITDRDIVMCALFQAKTLRDLRVSDATMAQEARTCTPGDFLADAENIMREGKIRRLPVVDDEGRLLGIISLADLAQEAARERSAKSKEITEEEVGDTLAAICEPLSPRLAA